MAKRKKHTEEFKPEAVKLMMTRGERSVADVAESLGVAKNMLYTWRRKYGDDPAVERMNGRGESAEEELRRLRRENAQLRRDREVLLRSVAVFARERT